MRSALTVYTLVLVTALFVFGSANAQQKPLYTYQQLSHLAYCQTKRLAEKDVGLPGCFF